MAISKTYYVCSKCGRGADTDHLSGWLIAKPKDAEKAFNGEMIIRCPDHVTDYAIRQAGNGRKDIRA